MNKSFYPTIRSSVFVFLILIGFTFIIGGPFALLPNYIDGFDKNVATAIAYVLPMLATIYVVYKRLKKKNGESKVFDFSFGTYKSYLLIIPLTLVMMLWVDFFASLIPMPDWIAEIFKEAFNLSIPNIVMVAIFAPILEETLVRGLVLKGYLMNYTPNKAIIASAVFFGIIHMNPWQFIGGFISGLFLGYLYYRTKSLIPSMFVHFMNNSLSVVFSIYYVDADASFEDMLGLKWYFVMLGISLILGYVLFRKLDVVLKEENP